MANIPLDNLLEAAATAGRTAAQHIDLQPAEEALHRIADSIDELTSQIERQTEVHAAIGKALLETIADTDGHQPTQSQLTKRIQSIDNALFPSITDHS